MTDPTDLPYVGPGPTDPPFRGWPHRNSPCVITPPRPRTVLEQALTDAAANPHPIRIRETKSVAFSLTPAEVVSLAQRHEVERCRTIRIADRVVLARARLTDHVVPVVGLHNFPARSVPRATAPLVVRRRPWSCDGSKGAPTSSWYVLDQAGARVRLRARTAEHARAAARALAREDWTGQCAACLRRLTLIPAARRRALMLPTHYAEGMGRCTASLTTAHVRAIPGVPQ